MDLLRGPGRLAALDAPGVNPFAARQRRSARSSRPPQTEEFLAAADRPAPGAGSRGQQIADGRRQLRRGHQRAVRRPASGRLDRNDVLAVAALIGARVRQGRWRRGAPRSLLDALQGPARRQGRQPGLERPARVQDPETSVTIDRRVPATASPRTGARAMSSSTTAASTRRRQAAFAATRRARRASNAAPGRGEAVGDRPPVVRRGSAGRLLLSRRS